VYVSYEFLLDYKQYWCLKVLLNCLWGVLLRLKDSGLSTQDGRSEVLKSIQNTSRLWEAGHSRERKTEHGLAEADALMGEVKEKKSLQLNMARHKHTYTLLSLLAFVTPT